jgi:hypothetical protein
MRQFKFYCKSAGRLPAIGNKSVFFCYTIGLLALFFSNYAVSAQDFSAPDGRVEPLLAKMTLDEKIGRHPKVFFGFNVKWWGT